MYRPVVVVVVVADYWFHFQWDLLANEGWAQDMERENEAWLDLRSVLYGFNKNQKEGKQMSVWLDSIFEKRPTHTHTHTQTTV